MIFVILFHVLLYRSVHAHLDFGPTRRRRSAGSPTPCAGDNGGTKTFEQPIQRGSRVLVGDIPSRVPGLEVRLSSTSDVDLQLTSNSIEVVNWEGPILFESSEVTKSWSEDLITYSGYNGDGTGLGNEFIRFEEETTNAYKIFAYGYDDGVATVVYTWTGQTNCTEQGVDAPGSGNFSDQIEEGTTVAIVELPTGLTDVFIQLDSTSDLDIQLYDGDVAIVSRHGGMANDSRFQEINHSGLQIQYSGFNGEQRSGSYGQEYAFIKGSLPRTLSLKVLAYESGSAEVTYSWGYYSNATSMDSNTLQHQLHDIIAHHTQLSYTPGVWDAIKRSDQDMDNPDNVLLFYTRRSEPKENQDNGSNGDDAWNREHIYAKSHGDFGTVEGPGTDLHHLRAADKSVNGERSNKDFAPGGAPLSDSESREDCPLCWETESSFEPPDEVKGDVARMIFYMVVRYNGDSTSNGVTLNVVDGVGTDEGSATVNNGVIGDLDSLKAWHDNDPVSNEERHRNNIIHVIQGNRNPFIDNPNFVDIIF